MTTNGALVDRNVSIRAASPDELDRLKTLDVDVFADLAYPDFVLRQIFDVHRECWLVAAHPSGLIGYSLGVPTTDLRSAWLLGLAVDARYRNRGHGRRLTLASLRLLRALGVRDVYLTVEPENEIALTLYRHIGFSVAALHRDYFGPGEDRLIMVRPFAGSSRPAADSRNGSGRSSEIPASRAAPSAQMMYGQL